MATKVVIDTNIFLNVVNRENGFYVASKAILDSVDEGKFHGLVSTITLAEMAAGYYQIGDEFGRKEFMLHLLSSRNYTIVSLDAVIADLAGKIRAETGLRLPDAVIIATGVKSNAEFIVSNDSEFMRSSNPLKTVRSEEFLSLLEDL